MATVFDPAQFIDLQTTEAASRRPPLPVGDYQALVENLEFKPWAKDDKSGVRCEAKLKITVPPSTKEQLGLQQDTITLTQSIFLDVNEAGGLDWAPGRNGQLRKYREALGQNTAGQPWSPRMMIGQPLLVKITHEMYEGEVQERVGGVAKLG